MPSIRWLAQMLHCVKKKVIMNFTSFFLCSPAREDDKTSQFIVVHILKKWQVLFTLLLLLLLYFSFRWVWVWIMPIRQRSSLSLELAVWSVAEVTPKKYAHESYKNLNGDHDHNINWVAFRILHKTCYIHKWVEMCRYFSFLYTLYTCVVH